MNFANALESVFGPARCEADIHPHDEHERAHLFRSFDGGSTELEVLNFLHSLILLMKPENALETGSGQGFGTIAIAAGMAHNGFGHLESTEFDPNTALRATAHIEQFQPKLLALVDIHVVDSMSFLESWQGDPFDFAFFDSDLRVRHLEFDLLLRRGKLAKGATCLFHDTSRHRGKYYHDYNPEMVAALDYSSQDRQWFESNYSRGIRLIRLA